MKPSFIILTFILILTILSLGCPATKTVVQQTPDPETSPPVLDETEPASPETSGDTQPLAGGIPIDVSGEEPSQEPAESPILDTGSEEPDETGGSAVQFVETVDDFEPEGWLREWGKGRVGITNGVAIDPSGNLLVTGTFSRRTDFDPGVNETELYSIGDSDVFVSKFNPDGELIWAVSFGGGSNERVLGIVLDGSGNSYLAGTFTSTADFDPDEENIVPLTATSRNDCYLMSLNPDGEYRWAQSWGGSRGSVDINAISITGSSPVVTGWFNGTIDFNPTANEDAGDIASATARSGSDAWVSKFSSSGAFQWTATWGGDTPIDQITTTSVCSDGGGNIITAGRFQGRFEASGTTGFDITIPWHMTNGGEDAFLLKMNSNGYTQWARTWGGEYNDYAHGVATSSGGNIYVTGGIDGTADLNPAGHKEDEHIVETLGYTFLSKFSPQGVYQWGRSWGDALGLSMTVDSSGNPIVTGVAKGAVDFDPDRSEDAVDEKSGSVFISKLNSSGDYLWALAFGRTDRDMGTGLITDRSGNIYATGMYRGALSFNPESGFVYTSSSTDPSAFLLKLPPDGSW